MSKPLIKKLEAKFNLLPSSYLHHLSILGLSISLLAGCNGSTNSNSANTTYLSKPSGVYGVGFKDYHI